MLYLFIISTLFLVITNFYNEIPRGIKLIYYIVYSISVLTFLIYEIFRAVKRY